MQRPPGFLILQGGSAAPPAAPIPEAQVMELQGRFDRFNSRIKLRPGDIVRPKQGLNMMPLCTGGAVQLILWRWLRLWSLHDRSLMRGIGVARPDCIIGFLDAGELCFIPCVSKMLEPVENHETREAE